MTDNPFPDETFRRPLPSLPLDDVAVYNQLRWRKSSVRAWPLDEPPVFGWFLAVEIIRGEKWLVRGLLRSVPNRPPALSLVTVEHIDREMEVTGTVIRDIRFGEIRSNALEQLRGLAAARALLAETGTISRERAAEAATAAAHVGDSLSRGPRGGYPTDHYRHIARLYIELAERVGPRALIAAMCEAESKRLGEPVKRERMRTWIRRATELKFLQPGKSGYAGRKPGPQLDKKERKHG